ncbi:MAG: IS1634 family transposase [Thermoplasmatota archaeon]
MIDKVEKDFGLFSHVFEGIEGHATDFIPQVQFHVYNNLSHSVSVNQLHQTYPPEAMHRLGMKQVPSKRTLYRTLERIGKYFPVILERLQDFITTHELADDRQVIDFSSSYVEGQQLSLAQYGYSRDRRPDKKQITYGIATGINGIPTTLTIQKGNTQDKKHMRTMLAVVDRVIPANALLIFDAGADTRQNRATIRHMGYHFLTLKAKRVSTYTKYLQYFTMHIDDVHQCEIHDTPYYCVKKRDGDTIRYIYFSPHLYADQITQKERKFERAIEKGNALLRKRKRRRFPSDKGWVELIPQLQTTLSSPDNPYINGLEGFFILESSVDAQPEHILRLYKHRDKAEKFFRNLKEGVELRPIRHWNTWSVIGIVFVCFLTNFLINLTALLSENPSVRNAKLLKKYLINLTLTVVYPPGGFRFHVLSNVSAAILSLFGDFVWKYRDKSLPMRW